MSLMKAASLIPMLVLSVSACTHQPLPREADFVFENVNVVPMTKEIVLADRAIAVTDGVITAIIDTDKAKRINAAQRIDGDGAYVTPGLADMHVHMRMDPEAFMSLNLANGVTTVHNMGDGDRNGDQKIDHTALRADVAAGRIDGPRYLISGPQLHEKEVPDLAAVEAVLNAHAEHGYDTMKIHGDLAPDVYEALIAGAKARGIRVTGHAQHMQPLNRTLRMDALEHMEEFLYSSVDDTFGESAAGGLDNYLNAYYANLARLKDPAYRAIIVKDVAASGVYMDPTLIIYAMIETYLDDEKFAALRDDPRISYLPKRTRASYLDPEKNEYRAGLGPLFQKFLDEVGAGVSSAQHISDNVDLLLNLTKELHDEGAPLLLGSDVFGALAPGFAVHQELEMLVTAGLTPYEALKTGTVNVAAYLGETDSAGTLEAGKRADFILLDGNPLKNIENAGRVNGVFSQEKWRSAKELEDILAEVKRLSAAD